MPSPLDFLLGGGGQPNYGDPNTFDPNNPLLRGLLMAAQQQQQPQDGAQASAAPPSSFGLLGPMMPQGSGLLAMRGDVAPIEGRSASAPVSLNVDGFQRDNPSDVEDPVKRSDGSYKLDTDPAGHQWAQQNAAKYGLQPDPNDSTVYRPLAPPAAAPQAQQPNASSPLMTMAPQPMSLTGAPAGAPVDATRGGPAAATAPDASNGPAQRAPDGAGANVIGTPASGTTEASSPGPDWRDMAGKAANVVCGIYGAGGPGDALIALGLSKRTDGASVNVLNSMNSARMQQSQQALLNMQMNQKLLSYAGNVQAVKQAFPGMSDAQAAAYAGSDAAMADVRKRLNPPRPNFGAPVSKDGVTWQQNMDTGEWVKKDEDANSSMLLSGKIPMAQPDFSNSGSRKAKRLALARLEPMLVRRSLASRSRSSRRPSFSRKTRNLRNSVSRRVRLSAMP